MIFVDIGDSWVTVREATRRLGMSEQAVRRRIASGDLTVDRRRITSKAKLPCQLATTFRESEARVLRAVLEQVLSHRDFSAMTRAHGSDIVRSLGKVRNMLVKAEKVKAANAAKRSEEA